MKCRVTWCGGREGEREERQWPLREWGLGGGPGGGGLGGRHGEQLLGGEGGGSAQNGRLVLIVGAHEISWDGGRGIP